MLKPFTRKGRRFFRGKIYIYQESSVCVLTSLIDGDMPVIIAIKANSDKKNKYLDINRKIIKADISNFIKSAYGRGGVRYHIGEILNCGAVLYANKGKTLKLFSDIGLELPESLNSLGFDSVIHQSDNIVNTGDEKKKIQKGGAVAAAAQACR